MGGGHMTHYDVFKAAELNNRKKEEEKPEKEKRDRKETELYKTNALKVLEHATERVIWIDQYINNQLETLLLWNGIQKSKQVRLSKNKKKWKDIKENNKHPPTYNKWMQ